MPFEPNTVPFSSLADQKAVDLASKYKAKKQRIAPTPDYSHLSFEDSSDTNLIDVGQASLARAGGNLADVGREISNKLFGTQFDASRKEGWSDPKTADELAGVSLAYRTKMEQDQQKVMDAVVDEDYMESLSAAGKVALRTAADSFATLPEVAIGSLATALTGGAAAPLLAKKAKDVFSTGEKIAEAYDKTKKLKEANRLGKALAKAKNLPAITAKAVGRASVLTADLQQQQVQDYREKYNEDPSPQRRAAITLGVLATTVWEPALIANFFIPNWRKELVKEGQNLVKNMGKGSNLINVAKRVGDATQKMVKAGVVESAQEYLQTWQEILAVEITPEEADNLSKAIASKIDDKEFRDKALTGGILGGMAGGVTRGAISAPAVAAGTAVDVTKAAAKGTAKVAGKVIGTAADISQKAVNRAGLAMLSEEEREAIRNDYQNKKAVFDDKVAEMDANIEKVTAAETYEEILADKNISKVAKEAQVDLDLTKEDMQNPKNLKKLKDKISRKYKAAEEVLDLKLKATTVGQVGEKLGKSVKEGAVKAYTDVIESEQVEKTVKAVKKYGDAAVTAVKEIRSSTALGLIEMGIEGGIGSTKVIVDKAKDLNLADLQRVIAAVEKGNPDLAKELERVSVRKRSFLKKVGQRSDELINEKTLSSVISQIAETGKLDSKDARGAAKEIRTTLAGRIADKSTLEKIKTAVEIYEQSRAYKTQDRGSIDETSMRTFKNRIATATSRLDREITGENIKETAEKGAKVVKKKIKTTLKERRKKKIREREKRIDEGKGDKSTLETITKKVKDAAKGAVKTLDEFAEDTADKVDEAIRDKKVLEEGELKSKLSIIGKEILKGYKNADEVAKSMNNIVKEVKNAGYETEEDLADLVKQFPFLAHNKDFYAKLESHFETTPKTAEETDVVMQKDMVNKKEDSVFSDNIIVNMYRELTGCKS